MLVGKAGATPQEESHRRTSLMLIFSLVTAESDPTENTSSEKTAAAAAL